MPHGTHLALDRDSAKRLFGSRDPESLSAFLDAQLTELSGSGRRFDLGEQWELVHRVLADGTIDEGGGEYPLSHAVLGGRPLDAGPDRTVRLIRPDSVGHLAAAIGQLDEELDARWKLVPDDYAGARDEAAFSELKQQLERLKQFFHQAASEQMAVVFVLH